MGTKLLGTRRAPLLWDRSDTGLGETAPTQSQISSFRSFTRLARSLAAAGDWNGANMAAMQASGLYVDMGSPSNLKDELDYATAAARGDSSAVADVRSNADLMSRGGVNSRSSSVILGSLGGFWEGLKKGASDIGQGKIFFGKSLGSPTDFTTPMPYMILLGGLVALRIAKVL